MERRHPELQTQEDEKNVSGRAKEATEEVWFERLQMHDARARFTVVAAAGSSCPGRRSSQQLKDYPPSLRKSWKAVNDKVEVECLRRAR